MNVIQNIVKNYFVQCQFEQLTDWYKILKVFNTKLYIENVNLLSVYVWLSIYKNILTVDLEKLSLGTW